MSEHSCSCGCHKIIVQCAPGVVAPPPTEGPPTGPPPTEGPPTTGPPPQVPCARALVRIDSIHVTKAEDFGFFGEPGAAAEWYLTVTVNDQSRTWINEDVRDGRDYPIGFDFPVDLVNEATTIMIRSSGYEEDDTSANDPLPSAERTHGSADNWGIGATKQLSASNSDFNYTINYTVTCLAQPLRSVISRQEAISTVQARLIAKDIETRRSEDELLTTFINKMAGRGIQLTQILPELLVWEGPMSIRQLITEVFPKK
jgi:hypothetical protein